MTLEVGSIYNVRHSRKGSFQVQVIEIGDEFITGIMTDGEAKQISAWNDNFIEGDEISLRIRFCEFSKV